MSPITPNIIINAVNGIINLPSVMNSTFHRRWKSIFGAPPKVCCILWNKFNPYETMLCINPKVGTAIPYCS
jgi:hypothetical protein